MDQLPVDCICHILAFTSPKDVCRLAGVSSAFRFAANSDFLWKTFLPADYREIIARSSSSSVSSFLNSLPEKALYFHLSDHPLIICDGNTSFALEKASGGKCYMIGVKRKYWTIEAKDPRSRFSQVAKGEPGTSIQINGKIETKNLTPNTYYAAYFVFKFMKEDDALSFKSILSCLYCEGAEEEKRKMVPFQGFSVERADGWMEIEIGQIFVEGNDTLVFFLSHTDGLKGELIIEGVEIRPISKKKEAKSLLKKIMTKLFYLSCILTPSS